MFFICSHNRAYEYFIESIKSKDCTFEAYECVKWESFLSGKCNNCSRNLLGLNSQKPDELTNYFLKTKPKAPYCDQISIQSSSNIKKDYCKSGAVNFSYFYTTNIISIIYIILSSFFE